MILKCAGVFCRASASLRFSKNYCASLLVNFSTSWTEVELCPLCNSVKVHCECCHCTSPCDKTYNLQSSVEALPDLAIHHTPKIHQRRKSVAQREHHQPLQVQSIRTQNKGRHWFLTYIYRRSILSNTLSPAVADRIRAYPPVIPLNRSLFWRCHRVQNHLRISNRWGNRIQSS